MALSTITLVYGTNRGDIDGRREETGYTILTDYDIMETDIDPLQGNRGLPQVSEAESLPCIAERVNRT